MNLYCDNYAICNQMYLARATERLTVDSARVRGWHVFSGTNGRGGRMDSNLCPTCWDGKATRFKRSDPPPGTAPLFLLPEQSKRGEQP